MAFTKRAKRIVCIIGFGAVFLVLLFVMQKLLMPKYISDIKEGNLIGEYYDSYKDHDVIFVGDSDVYHSFIPLELWDEYGISSYVRGTAAQTVQQSYYIIEETLKYETPKVIVFNVFAMQTDENKESYNRMTLDNMKWSLSKLNSVRTSLTSEESLASYVFPLLRFHSRWKEISTEDFKYIFSVPRVSECGYLRRTETVPAVNVPAPGPLSKSDFSEENYKYLDKMVALCKKNNVELILIKAPALYPFWYEEWEEAITNYANEKGISYYNFLEDGRDAEAGLDFNTDTCDGGLHLNEKGAEKLTSYFGKILKTEHGLSDRSLEVKLADYWERERDNYRSVVFVTPMPSVGAEAQNTPKPENTKEPEKLVTPAPSASDNSYTEGKGFFFETNGTELFVDVRIELLLSKLPEPLSVFEAPSCAAQGNSYIYSFEGFQMETYPDGELNPVAYITLTGDEAYTVEGIGLGFTREDVIEIYGEADREDELSMLYLKEGNGLRFYLRDDSVYSIQYVAEPFLND